MDVLNSLIEQAKNPRGFLGKIMLGIMNSAHRQLMSWGLSKIKICDDFIVLDVGCGGGKTIKMLSDIIKNGKIYGIDYSEEAVLTSSNENKEEVQKGKVIIKQASVSDIPFQDNFFDLVSAFQTHYFWPDLKKDVKEIYRVLKTTGQFVLVSELYKINYHMTEYKTAKALKSLLLESGFIDVRVFETKKEICFVCTK